MKTQGNMLAFSDLEKVFYFYHEFVYLCPLNYFNRKLDLIKIISGTKT